MGARLPAAILVLALLAGGLWWVATLAPHGTSASAQDVPTYVVGRDGGVLANGTVHVRPTPLAAVEALGAARGFTVELRQDPQVGGGCTAAYVVGIAGQRETATGGWNYYVRRPGTQWGWEPAGAGCYTLSPGDQVEWCWVETDVCRHHAP